MSDSGASWHVSQKGLFGGGFFGALMLSPTLGFVSGQNFYMQGMKAVMFAASRRGRNEVTSSREIKKLFLRPAG